MRALPSLTRSSGLTADCIEAISTPPAPIESIFPNLRTVGLHEPSATVTPLIQHLTNPKVTDIWLGRTEILGSTIDVFGQGCPFVTTFQVSQWAHSDTTSSLICHWQNLRAVHCYHAGLNVDALSHLSRLGNLRDMSFKVHDAVVDQLHATRSSPSTLTFSALRDLHLNSPSLTPAGRLLCHFRIPEIHDISVGLSACPTAPDLMAFFAALQGACTHASLNDLSLRVYHDNDESVMPSVENSYYITSDRLRPLTVFVNIKSITLDIPCGVDLNEHDFLNLASSWPHLECFEVGENHDWTTSSALTPGKFVELLERCKSLRVLSFVLDTRGYTEIPQGHPWRGLKMPKNTYIHLLNSPIEEESIEALGVFFHVAPYPNFGLSTHWNNPYFRGRERPQELCDLYYNRWVRARTIAHDLWKKKRDLRLSLETQSSQRFSGDGCEYSISTIDQSLHSELRT